MAKIGRNNPCPCGSGEKYKKCCLLQDVKAQVESKKSTSKNILVSTLTNELFQPIRLYYKIYNKEKLELHFRKLKCMNYMSAVDAWNIMYIKEAASIPLKISSKKVPKAAQPLVIAKIYIKDNHTMLIDLRSIERAAKIIEFIDKHVPCKIAKVTHAAIYNKLITCPEKHPEKIKDIDYDEIFSENNITLIDPEKAIKENKNFALEYADKQKALSAFIKKSEQKSKHPPPEVEKFPVHYYDDGIMQFEICCRMRQAIATQHFLGNKNFSFYDLIQGAFKRT